MQKRCISVVLLLMLSAVSTAQKHLLRMGPVNARIVVEKLKAFRAASAPTP